MTNDQIILLIGGTGILLSFCAGFLVDLTKKRTAASKNETPQQDGAFGDEGEIVTFHAKVIDMTCGVKTVPYQGYKQPKAVKHFIITFQKEDGAVLSVSVPEDMYEGFEIGLFGMLTLIDGELSSFEPDERT